MGGKGAVRRAWTYNVRSSVRRRTECCAQLCEKKKRTRARAGGGAFEGRARPASSGKAQQATRVAPYPAWGREAEKETTQKHLEMFL